MHSKGSRQLMMGVAASFAGIFQVILKHRTIIGMCYLDEFLGLLHIALMTEVRNTILGDDCIDEMVGMIDMTGKRNDAGDGTTLSG